MVINMYGILSLIILFFVVVVLCVIYSKPSIKEKERLNNSQNNILFCSDNKNSYIPVKQVFEELDSEGIDIGFLKGASSKNV